MEEAVGAYGGALSQEGVGGGVAGACGCAAANDEEEHGEEGMWVELLGDSRRLVSRGRGRKRPLGVDAPSLAIPAADAAPGLAATSTSTSSVNPSRDGNDGTNGANGDLVAGLAAVQAELRRLQTAHQTEIRMLREEMHILRQEVVTLQSKVGLVQLEDKAEDTTFASLD